MVYLIWGLLNIVLALLFIFICFRATKLVREIGLAASIVFVLGVLSYMLDFDKEKSNNQQGSKQRRAWIFNPKDSLINRSTYNIEIDLEKTFLHTYLLRIVCAQDINSKRNIPISAYSWASGFESGTTWHPLSIEVNKTADNKKFEYRVEGEFEWTLLASTFYSQEKIYKGFALIK